MTQSDSGNKIRANIKHWPANEEQSESFQNTEQQRQSRQNIDLQQSQPQKTTIDVITKHYNELWATERQTINHDAYLAEVKQLDPNEFELDPTLITIKEITEAINSLKGNSAPGTDGLPTEFYVEFSKQLTPTLQCIYNNSYFQKQLPPSQKQALIKLIPKNPKPTKISHWRPISLLNCDYKILSKIIAKRLTKYLCHYILINQQCGLPNRQMVNIHHNILAAIQFSQDAKTPITILQLDFSKAFDNLSHDFLFATLKRINIPSQLITWIHILLTDISSTIQVNDKLTDNIPLRRGIRQGCPLSMLLFILATDVLTQKIENSSSIQGLKLSAAQIKTQQYADDTTLIITDQD